MFEVRNNRNEVVREEQNYVSAKGAALEMDTADRQYKLGNGPFSIYEVKQVWTTQTLDEAMSGRTLADRPRVPVNFKD